MGDFILIATEMDVYIKNWINGKIVKKVQMYDFYDDKNYIIRIKFFNSPKR